MMLVGYLEGIHSERGICWRCADSISLRDFLGLPNHIAVPDQTTVSRTRRRSPVDVFDEVFRLVLGIVSEKGLLKGRILGVDWTYLQADASMKSIVRKDSGDEYAAYIRRLATEASDETAAADRNRNDDDVDPPSRTPEAPATERERQDNVGATTEPRRQSSREEAIRYDRKRE